MEGLWSYTIPPLSGLSIAFSVAAALPGGGDAEAFAVFGDGAAGDFASLAVQEFGDPVVGERVGGVFGGDELADALHHRAAGEAFAVVAAHAAAEEVFEGEQSARRLQVFPRDGAAHGRFVEIELLRHVAQGQRLQRFDPVVEKALLPRGDHFGDAADRGVAQRQRPDQVAGGFELGAEVFVILRRERLVGGHPEIAIGDVQPHRLLAGADVVIPVFAADDLRLRRHVDRGRAVQPRRRERVQGADAGDPLVQFLDGKIQLPRQRREPVRRDLLQVVIHKFVEHRVGLALPLQLEPQTFGGGTGGDPRRVEGLHMIYVY